MAHHMQADCSQGEVRRAVRAVGKGTASEMNLEGPGEENFKSRRQRTLKLQQTGTGRKTPGGQKSSGHPGAQDC